MNIVENSVTLMRIMSEFREHTKNNTHLTIKSVTYCDDSTADNDDIVKANQDCKCDENNNSSFNASKRTENVRHGPMSEYLQECTENSEKMRFTNTNTSHHYDVLTAADGNPIATEADGRNTGKHYTITIYYYYV